MKNTNHITKDTREKLLINTISVFGYDTFIIFHNQNFVKIAKYIHKYPNNAKTPSLA
jgi:hypothetical protein